MTPAALRPPVLVLQLEGADRAVGRRHAVRVSDGRSGRIRRIWPSSSGAGRSGKFPLLVDDGEAVVETTPIIEHLQAHHPGPNRWIPDGEPGRRVRFLDRFFDLYVMNNMQLPGVRRASARRHARPLWRGEGDGAVCAPPTTGSRRTSAMARGRSGEQFTLADCAAAPSLFYADWVEEIGPHRPRLPAYRARLLAHPIVAPRGRRGPALSRLLPARRARPRLVDQVERAEEALDAGHSLQARRRAAR